MNVAFLDESIVQICLIDILYDLKRLKEFHNVENVSYERIVAYSAGWIVRRQPFQRLNMSDVKRTQERYLYLNEKFAMTLMVEMLATKDGKVKAIKGKKAEVERLLNRLLYHLRFRNVEPRVLELLMCGMKLGLAVEK